MSDNDLDSLCLLALETYKLLEARPDYKADRMGVIIYRDWEGNEDRPAEHKLWYAGLSTPNSRMYGLEMNVHNPCNGSSPKDAVSNLIKSMTLKINDRKKWRLEELKKSEEDARKAEDIVTRLNK